MNNTLFAELPFIDFVYMDISDQYEELEALWNAMRSKFVNTKTIIVVNMYGAALGVCKFVIQHLDNLQPIYKPASFAKAFIFVDETSGKQVIPSNCKSLRKVNFVESPDWGHHRKGAFCDLMNFAADYMNTGQSEVLFVPAVEQYLESIEHPITEPWMGILHQAPSTDHLWVMDAKTLLRSPQFLESLPYCKGLYTLTTHLQKFIRTGLPPDQHVPVCRLFYALTTSISVKTGVPRTTIVMIGGYMRNFDDFEKLGQIEGYQKVWLIGEEEMATPDRVQHAQDSNIKILRRLSDEDYEILLQQSIVFLATSTDGFASTLVVECILSNTPILISRTEAFEEYLGQNYPLFFDDVTRAAQLLESHGAIERTIDYLTGKNSVTVISLWCGGSHKN